MEWIDNLMDHSKFKKKTVTVWVVIFYNTSVAKILTNFDLPHGTTNVLILWRSLM